MRYCDKKEFENMNRWQVDPSQFRALAEREGWEPKTVELMFLFGPPSFPVKCGNAIYEISGHQRVLFF
jgi:hypothetical protein